MQKSMKSSDSEYPKYAEHAAWLERAGKHKDAAFAWQQAAGFARTPANRTWAESREAFCHTWAAFYSRKRKVAA